MFASLCSLPMSVTNRKRFIVDLIAKMKSLRSLEDIIFVRNIYSYRCMRLIIKFPDSDTSTCIWNRRFLFFDKGRCNYLLFIPASSISSRDFHNFYRDKIFFYEPLHLHEIPTQFSQKIQKFPVVGVP